MGGFFTRKAATDQRLLKRSCESLLGICSGLLADGHLVDQEIVFLDTWLADHSDIATTWPGEVVWARIRDVLADGEITEAERDYLVTTLQDLMGGDLEQIGATSGAATRLPIDDVGDIRIPGSRFCFTGNLLYGTRAACERAITERGGDVLAGVRMDLDYLVIGTLASRDWANTSHGRKIEKAMTYKSKGRPICIIAEEQWVQAL